MAEKLRHLISRGGAQDGQSAWYDAGHPVVLPVAALDGLHVPIWIVPTANSSLVGSPAPDPAASTDALFNLYGAQVCFDHSEIAEAGAAMTLSVYRAGTALGTAPCFGWTVAGGGVPAFATALVAVAMPALTNSALSTPTGGTTFMPLRAGDVVTADFTGNPPSGTYVQITPLVI